MTESSIESSQEAQTVKEIDQDSIRFLAAGEKINDIETAIRELVENSVDAQAKNIEVRLAKFGIDAIEVDDNGTGIDEQNFDLLGIRYHTSKISDFKNLQESLQTFGFRGEALSCLCNIANVTITTKTKSSPTGWKLTFKKDGTLSKKDRVARDNGTTVILKNLFHSLPVRRRELETNAKKQYDKIVKLIYEQALARPHIKFSLCKKAGAKKDKDFTHGGTTLEGCLITIFGIKILDALLPIRQHGLGPISSTLNNDRPTSCDQTNENKSVVEQEDKFEREGDEILAEKVTKTTEVDNCSSDATRSAASAASTSFSQLGLDVTLSQTVEPSRDEIFFKRSRKSRSKFAREKPEYLIYGYISKIGCGRNSSDGQYTFVNKKPCDIPKLARLVNETFRSFNQNQHYPFYCLFIQVQSWATDFNVPRKRGVILQEENKLFDMVRESLERMYSSYVPASQKSCPIAQIPFATNAVENNCQAKDIIDRKQLDQQDNSDRKQQDQQDIPQQSDKPEISVNQVQQEGVHDHPMMVDVDRLTRSSLTVGNDVADSIPDLFEIAPKRARMMTSTSPSVGRPLKDNAALPGFQNGYDLFVEEITASTLARETAASKISSDSTSNQTPLQENDVPKQRQVSPQKRSMAPPPLPQCRFKQAEISQDGDIKVSIDFLEDLSAAYELERAERRVPSDEREFSFAIHPKFNTPAVEELKFHLNKTSFMDMQVLGQFNKGFIIARLNKHLFIIDQHATDERANYEEQIELSPLVKQQMVYPKPLYLNLIQENAILNNMDAFVKRGFEFVVDPSKLVGYRVMLSSTSICRIADRDEHLGKEDVEELVDVAIESPTRLESYTLSKVKNLSASIACRKSVMIGDKLTWQQMSRIVERMSNLKNPWVCAHNRPTIRHLMDTNWMK